MIFTSHWARRRADVEVPAGCGKTLGSGAGASLKQVIICAAILLPLAVAAICGSVWFSGRIGGADMDRNGYIALVIGVVATLALGIGLMGLVFYSSRHGYDEGARRQ